MLYRENTAGYPRRHSIAGEVSSWTQTNSFRLSFYLSVFALVLILPLVLIILFMTHRYIDAERTKEESISIGVAVHIGLAIDREMATLINGLESLAASPALYNDFERLRLQAQELIASRKGELFLLDVSGRDLLRDTKSYLPDEYIAALRQRLDLGIRSDISGLLLEVQGRGRQVAFSVVVPSSGAQSAALVLTIPSVHFTSLLQGPELMAPLSGSLVDKSGVLIARTSENQSDIGRSVLFTSNISKDYGFLDAVDANGVAVRQYYRRSPVSGWFTLISVPYAVLQNSLHQSLWLLTGIAVSLFLMGAPCAYLMVRRMQLAVQITMEAARALGKGELIAYRHTGVVETDMVSRTIADASVRLHKQAEDLRNNNVELERRVADRTQELAESHALTDSILKSTPDTVKVLDASGRIIFTNSCCNHLPGSTFDMIFEGKIWTDSWPESGGSEARQALTLAQQGKPSRFTAWRRQASNEPRWLDVLLTPMLDEHGDTQRILAISRDITVQHHQDEELRIAKERAEAASVAKAEFLANMSHELRTPLNGILGYADLLASDLKLTPTQRQRLDHIQHAAGALLSIVNDILDFTKIESGDMTLHLRPFSLAKLLDDAAALTVPMATAKALSLDVVVDQRLPLWLKGDPERLRQIVLNLLGNAIKFTETGSIHLSLEVEKIEADRCHFILAVRDTGIGIPSEHQHLLFKRFSQVDASSKRRFGGAGLGLAISHYLTEQMEGSIKVQSVFGSGSTFTLSLSLQLAEEESLPAEENAHPCNVFEANVLVVEDVSLNRDLMDEMLKALGCRVDLVASGEAAIRAVQEKSYDLVLMDEHMPGMSGTAATQVIRTLDHPACEVPIIACSADVFSHQVRRFQLAGMNGHVGKPLTQAVLTKVLIRHAFQLKTPRLDGRRTITVARDVSMQSWLSKDRLNTAWSELRQDLSTLAENIRSYGTSDGTAAHAHSVISTACILDLPELSRACQRFEVAHRSGVGQKSAIEELSRVIKSTLEHIASVHLLQKETTDGQQLVMSNLPDSAFKPAHMDAIPISGRPIGVSS